MNHNIKPFKGLIRRSFYTHKESDQKTFDPCYVFGIHSLEGKILMFHVMTNFGMMRSRVPISELFWKEPTKEYSPTDKVLWNSFSTKNCEVVEYDYLSGMTCEIILRDKQTVKGEYLMTVDWYDNGFSDEPSEYKCLHVIKGECGNLFGQPNNRIIWREPSFVCEKFPIEKSEIKVDLTFVSVENTGRWAGDNYFYDVNEK